MKKIAITMGDSGGIGPEIILKALSFSYLRKICIPVVIGDMLVIESAKKLLRLPARLKAIESISEAKPAKDSIYIIHESNSIKNKIMNKPTFESGRACILFIQKAVALALKKEVDTIVTAPISKESLKMAESKWHGHTEMLANLSRTKDYAMMFAGGPLKIILVTIHTALRNVPDLITRKKILKTIYLAKRACEMFSIKNPKIAVAGLNPHAGESGIFGDEEIRKITPAIKYAQKEGIDVKGPYPPDIIFHKAYKGEFDIVICMYHDQGLIPLKMIAFDKGVNITVGLPFVRTSPDHGTAYDIAWKGIADPSSMVEAIKLAVKLKN